MRYVECEGAEGVESEGARVHVREGMQSVRGCAECEYGGEGVQSEGVQCEDVKSEDVQCEDVQNEDARVHVMACRV